MTIHNLGTKTTILGLLRNDVVTATATGSAIDLLGYEGDMAVLLDATGGAFTTTTANTASLQKITVNVTSLKRFVKATATVAGGTGAGAVAVIGLASAKYG